MIEGKSLWGLISAINNDFKPILFGVIAIIVMLFYRLIIGVAILFLGKTLLKIKKETTKKQDRS